LKHNSNNSNNDTNNRNSSSNNKTTKTTTTTTTTNRPNNKYQCNKLYLLQVGGFDVPLATALCKTFLLRMLNDS
jgi:hypothetical protein